MDGVTFDRFSRACATAGTRRGLTRLLLGLPVLAGLLAQLGTGSATAEDDDHGSSHRRKRRKRRHDPGGDKDNRQGKRNGKRKGKRKKDSCGTCPVCQGCDPRTGQCVNLANGTPCDDGNACTQTDTCRDGVCVGGTPIVCDTPGVCEFNPGTCNPVTGACNYPDKCPSGQDCLGNGTCAISCTCTPNCNVSTCPGECAGCSIGPDGSFHCVRFFAGPATCGCTVDSCGDGQICGGIATSTCPTGFGCFEACTP